MSIGVERTDGRTMALSVTNETTIISDRSVAGIAGEALVAGEKTSPATIARATQTRLQF